MDPQNDLVLRDSQNWAARSHRELYDSVHHFNDPGQAGEIGSEWAQFGTELTESAQLIAKRVAASESGWTGTAAEGARAAIRELAEWITQTARTAVEVGDKVAAQGRIMEGARARMPEPSTFTLDAAARAQGDPGLAGFTASTADMQAASEKARAAHEQAVAVMETMERLSHDIDATTPAFTLPYNPVTGKEQEPPQPMMFSSTGVASLSGASGPPPVGQTSTPDAAAPPPPPGGAQPMTPAASYSGPAGTGAPAAQSPQAPSSQPAAYHPAAQQPAAYQPASYQPASYQPPAHQPPCESTAVAAASAPSHQPQAAGYGAPSGAGYQAPAEHRPQQYGTPAPWTPQQNVPRTSTSGTADPRNLPRTAAGTPGAAQNAVPSNADPRSAGRPATGPGAFGGGSGGGGGGGGAMRGGFPAGHVAAGGPAGGTPMQSGGAAGVTHQSRGPVPAGGVGPGAAAAAGAGSPMGGAPAGGPASGKGEEDKEHRAASYLMGGNLFEVPGADLPPAVIGASKPKKKQPPAPEQTT